MKIKTTEGTIEIRTRDLDGKLCRPVRDLRSKLLHLRVGALCRISGTWRSGVNLEPLEPITADGNWHGITKVHHSDIRLELDPPLCPGGCGVYAHADGDMCRACLLGARILDKGCIARLEKQVTDLLKDNERLREAHIR